MPIFDFYDDDENANGIIQLRASETKKQEKKSNRRSTLVIQNNIPSYAICKECLTSKTSQTMTDSDKCKLFYHFACCTPPLTSFPKRKSYGWACHRCSDDSEHETSNEVITTPSPKVYLFDFISIFLDFQNSKRDQKSQKEILTED